MATKQGKVGENKSEVIRDIPLACASEPAAVEFMERQRWGDTPCCPRCGSVNVYKMMDTKTGGRNRRYLWRCRDCAKAQSQFTVKIGTVMEDSRIPYRHWCYAFWRAATSKKGVAAKEIQRQTGLSYKSSLFLMHRIRFGMADNAPKAGKLDGIVECDETHVGGKPRKHYNRAAQKAKGEAASPNARTIKDRKTPVFGAVERGGRVSTRVIPDVTSKTLRKAVNDMVETTARLMTDEHVSYGPVGVDYASHETVNHKKNEYVRGDVTTNTIESFWAILKRGIYGIWHNVSRKHLHRYASCAEFRYNHRKLNDGERTTAVIKACDGKRLTYRDQVEGA